MVTLPLPVTLDLLYGYRRIVARVEACEPEK